MGRLGFFLSFNHIMFSRPEHNMCSIHKFNGLKTLGFEKSVLGSKNWKTLIFFLALPSFYVPSSF